VREKTGCVHRAVQFVLHGAPAIENALAAAHAAVRDVEAYLSRE
jgi:hypothetical protein